MAEADMSGRTYRLSPPDRTGALLGLGGPQVMVMGAGLLAAVAARSAGAPTPVVVLPLAVGVAVGLARVGGRPLLEVTPPALAWAAVVLGRRRRWLAPVSEMGMHPDAGPALPPPLDGQVLLAVDPPANCAPGWHDKIAVVHDRGGGSHRLALVLVATGSALAVAALGQLLLAGAVAGAGAVLALVSGQGSDTYSATLRVSGAAFDLAEGTEQDRLVALWGNALGAFCRERAPVAWVRWAQFAAPAGIEEHLAYLAEHGHDDATDPAVASYRSLVAAAGPAATRQEVLVTVTVDAFRVVAGTGPGAERGGAAVEVLMEELALLAARLETAGLVVAAPLAPQELARALRVRLDPTVAATLDRRGRSLGEVAGVVCPANAGPLAAEADWSGWRVDGSLHRSFLVVDWPRLAVAADWMGELLRWRGAVRTVAVVYEPVAPAASRRAIRREMAKLDSDAEHRSRAGFRVPAAVHRAAEAVAEREAELADGYPELDYAGLVTLSAPDAGALARASAALIQVAAGVGVELRPLDGRHGAGVGACLPLARALGPRGLG
ncbi:MAG: hypothetical protein KY439_00160 [Actinobacteria bacterium]|nr:hypothetical protein [Actinomycetota bacterium]